MTKEEIFEKHSKVFYDANDCGTRVLTRLTYEKAMQEYADQETERLKAELNEMKDEIAILKAEKRIAFDLGYKTAASEAVAEIRKNYKPND